MHTGNIEEKHVIGLCNEISPNCNPITIPCRPLLAESINDCFDIVPRHVAQHGGSQVIGWAIWEWPRVLVEAEFHAVWRSTNDELVCLTPRPIAFDTITFLPSTHAQYEGKQVDNIRHALSNDNDITRFIFLAKKKFDLFNRGNRAYLHGDISLSDREMKEFFGIKKEMQTIYKKLVRRYQSK